MEQYIQPFIDTCISVFKDFVAADLVAQQVYFIEKNDFQQWDISGIIGLTGEAKGAVAISMKEDVAIKLTATLTGKKHTDLDDDVVDAVGEIVNIIAGNVKKELEEMFHLVISIPTTIKGKDHSVVWPIDKNRIMCIPFNIYGDKKICLSVALNASK